MKKTIKYKKLDVYVPILFKLRNDSAIIHSDLMSEIFDNLKTIKTDSDLNLCLQDSNRNNFYILNPKEIDVLKEYDNKISEITGSLFYYHHRLIFHYQLHFEKIKDVSFRKVRMELIEYTRNLTGMIIDCINHTIDNPSQLLLNKPHVISNVNDIKITTFYSYAVVFRKKPWFFLQRDNQIQTFNIRTLQSRFLPLFRTSLLRISIPNITAYYSWWLQNEYRAEIINTVYKICLYPKKIEELPTTNKLTKFNLDVSKKHQLITEERIMTMWDYCLDSFGGKRTDQIGNKGAIIGLIFSIIALAFSIFGLF